LEPIQFESIRAAVVTAVWQATNAIGVDTVRGVTVKGSGREFQLFLTTKCIVAAAEGGAGSFLG
jgi:hypothetical protein